jgi:CSLREA domain-containing protein
MILEDRCTPAGTAFVVNTLFDTSDANLGDGLALDGKGKTSLRAAIEEANAGNASNQSIFFSATVFPVGKFTSIQLSAALPSITKPVTIDAYDSRIVNQSANVNEPTVVLDGTNVGLPGGILVSGLVLAVDNCSVRGLDIINFNGAGIIVNGSLTTIEGNWIGFTRDNMTTGIVDAGNYHGIYIGKGCANVIGGSDVFSDLPYLRRNTITANSVDGILIDGEATTDNRVIGNWIGLDAEGKGSGLQQNGVHINNSPQNTIGGSESTDLYPMATDGNVISANATSNVLIEEESASGNLVIGNLIGLNPSGTARADAPGNNYGIEIVNAPGNQVGGIAGESGFGNRPRNVIVSSEPVIPDTEPSLAFAAVRIAGEDASNNMVQGNFIGTEWTGLQKVAATDAPAGGFGLDNGVGIIITDGANDNTIGGSSLYAGNVIAGNTHGVVIQGVVAEDDTYLDPSDNVVQNNKIGVNVQGISNQSTANSGDGVRIDNATNNLIGGAFGTEGNIISGNGKNGVHLLNGSAANEVFGNLIGLASDGDTGAGNKQNGVLIELDSPNNTIGQANGKQNVISSNGESGVRVVGNGSSPNQIIANTIGLGKNGTGKRGNTGDGIWIEDASNNQIGGLLPFFGNRVAANGQNGIRISGGKAAKNNKIWFNVLGEDANGAAAENGAKAIDAQGDGTSAWKNRGRGKQDVAFLFQGETESQIVQNTLVAGDGDALDIIDCTDVLVEDNDIGTPDGGFGGDGAFVNAGSNGVDFFGNIVTKNAGNGIHTVGASDVTVSFAEGETADHANVIFANGGWGIKNVGGQITTYANRVGIDPDGNPGGNGLGGIFSAAAGNSFSDFVAYNHGAGYDVEGNNNSIFGAYVYANDDDGIDLTGDTITVLGCTIGTDETGAADLGNGGDGVHLDYASNVTIGGPDGWVVNIGSPPTWVPANVIVHNGGSGVAAVQDSGPNARIVVQSDLIAYNRYDGVALTGTTHTVTNDVVYANLLNGVKVGGDGTSIQGCHVGTDLALAAGLGNGRDGIFLSAATDATIGGVGPVNVIWNNAAAGIGEAGGYAGNGIYGNSIYNNGGLGIDLGEDGVTDPGLTLPPGGTGWVTFHGAANTAYVFQFYVSPAPDPTHYGEGRDPATLAVMSYTSTTDANGNLTFQISCGNMGMWLSATATNWTTGTTSEFCHDVYVDGSWGGGIIFGG